MKKTKHTSVLCAILAVILGLATPVFAAEDSYGKYPEPVKITIMGIDNSATTYDSSIASRKSANENMWIDAYLEYLNIDLERITPEDAQALNAVLTTSLASGSLPDIMYVPKTMFYVLAENGVLADLSEVYAENCGPLVSEAVATFPEAMETGYYEGKLLGFPVIQNIHNVNAEVLWIRQDWLDAVGMDAPTTMDELYEVANAFVAAELGGPNTYGIAAYNIPEPIMSAFGAVKGTWAQQEDGTCAYANTLPAMKEGLLYMQKLYAEGLIRNDFAVGSDNDTAQVWEDIANGLVGITYANATWGVLCIQTCYNNDPDADWIAVRIPTETGENMPQLTNKVITSFLVVNKDCGNPEALFKILELELHMYYEPRDEERVIYHTCPDGYLAENLRAIRLFGQAGYNVLVCNKIVEGLAAGIDDITPLANSQYQLVKQGLAGDRSLKGRAYVYTDAYSLVSKLMDSGLLVAEYNGPMTQTMTLYQDTINTALNNAMLKIVMGADISTFDEAVATWYATGGQTITDEINDYYASR